MVEMWLVVWVVALAVGVVGVGVRPSPMGAPFWLGVLLDVADVVVHGHDESWTGDLDAGHVLAAWHGVRGHCW